MQAVSTCGVKQVWCEMLYILEAWWVSISDSEWCEVSEIEGWYSARGNKSFESS